MLSGSKESGCCSGWERRAHSLIRERIVALVLRLCQVYSIIRLNFSISVERGAVPQPGQPEEQQLPVPAQETDLAPEQDLFLAKGDQQKGREVSGTPPPQDGGKDAVEREAQRGQRRSSSSGRPLSSEDRRRWTFSVKGIERRSSAYSN